MEQRSPQGDRKSNQLPNQQITVWENGAAIPTGRPQGLSEVGFTTRLERRWFRRDRGGVERCGAPCGCPWSPCEYEPLIPTTGDYGTISFHFVKTYPCKVERGGDPCGRPGGIATSLLPETSSTTTEM